MKKLGSDSHPHSGYVEAPDRINHQIIKALA